MAEGPLLPDLLYDGPADAALTIALAHGAGAPMDTPFMDAFAQGLAGHGFRVARFEFPYMAQRRTGGNKRPPNPAKILNETWQAVIDQLGPDSLIIGGKSMGGRYASMIADKAGVKGLVCLGYPFHPPGKPDNTRIDHLRRLKTPALILQGTRDSLGAREEVSAYPLDPAIRVHWLEDGDHGFKPRKKSGRTEAQNWDEAIETFAAFAGGL
ncbi:MAG: dienelactone hydrolase family protein [Rhodospirillales bacterium]|nr:dienelactone hydrolase family protein [Rhodospirillales bacterium]